MSYSSTIQAQCCLNLVLDGKWCTQYDTAISFSSFLTKLHSHLLAFSHLISNYLGKTTESSFSSHPRQFHHFLSSSFISAVVIVVVVVAVVVQVEESSSEYDIHFFRTLL